jgi:lysozyme
MNRVEIIELVKDVDNYVDDRFVYVNDPDHKDTWRSHAKAMRKDPKYVVYDDCDGKAQTAIHEIILRGLPKSKTYRALVQTKDSTVIDHMIGLVEVAPNEFWSIGDTMGKPSKVIGGVVNGHRVIETSRVSEGHRSWRNWFRRRRRVTNTANMGMRTSPKGVDFIKSHEQYRARAYDDARPHYHFKVGDVPIGTLTIGYGHTGPDVKPGMMIDEAEAERLLRGDLREAERGVSNNVRVDLTQEQFDALVSFVFNTGEGNFKSSTLRKRINSRASLEEIQYQFRRWIYGRKNGRKVVFGGLVRRREDEAIMFGAEPDEAPQEVHTNAKFTDRIGVDSWRNPFRGLGGQRDLRR